MGVYARDFEHKNPPKIIGVVKMNENLQHTNTASVANDDPVQQEETVMTEAPVSNAADANVVNDISNQSEVSTTNKPLTKKEEMLQYKEELKAKARVIVEEYQDFYDIEEFKEAVRQIFPELRRKMKPNEAKWRLLVAIFES